MQVWVRSNWLQGSLQGLGWTWELGGLRGQEGSEASGARGWAGPMPELPGSVCFRTKWITQHPSLGPMPLKMDLPPGDPGVLPLSCPQECPDPHCYPGPRSPTPGLPSSAVNDDLLLLPSSLPSVTKGLPRCQLWNEGCPWEVMTLRYTGAQQIASSYPQTVFACLQPLALPLYGRKPAQGHTAGQQQHSWSQI